jgi:aryl-alcohol dehydrogenase-like predicted oxidoreductase
LKLGIGTVQFGLPYGVANQTGQTKQAEAERILNYAWHAGIDTIDTAIAYGDSEKVLGNIGVSNWRVISKLPAIPNSCESISQWVQDSVNESLERLKLSKLNGLLLHRSQQLTESGGTELYQALDTLKSQGLVEKIGVSIYEPDELDAIPTSFKLDLVQTPYNICDRRIATSGWLDKLNNSGTEVHIRAVFLQGLLLMDPLKIPEKFDRWKLLWKKWHAWLEEQNLTAIEACLAFTINNPKVDRVLVGIDSLMQLEEIIEASQKQEVIVPHSFSTGDTQLLNPVNWL